MNTKRRSGQFVRSFRMRKIIDTYRPGDKVTVVYEHNGKTYETEIILAATPENN